MAFQNQFCAGMIKKLWQYSMGCAISARWLSKQCGFEIMVEEASVGGMIHDIGKLLLLIVLENISRSGDKSLIPSMQLINEVMDTFHSEHGYMFIKKWDLTDFYCKVVKEHHYEDVDPNDTLLTIVRLANKACNKVGIGPNRDPSLILSATLEANHLCLSEIFLAELEIKLEDFLVQPKPPGTEAK